MGPRGEQLSFIPYPKQQKPRGAPGGAASRRTSAQQALKDESSANSSSFPLDLPLEQNHLPGKHRANATLHQEGEQKELRNLSAPTPRRAGAVGAPRLASRNSSSTKASCLFRSATVYLGETDHGEEHGVLSVPFVLPASFQPEAELGDEQRPRGFAPGGCDVPGLLVHLPEGRHGSGVRVLARENKKGLTKPCFPSRAPSKNPNR